ncbi:MAG: hypothetical protein ACYTGZ_10745 [Planctomycetota bacterium]|jgi:hypothetical protein
MQRLRYLLVLLLTFTLVACGSGSPAPANNNDDPAEPAFDAANFTAASFTINHQYFPLKPGTTMAYQLENEDEELETIVVEVLDDTRIVNGIRCAIVRDRVFIGELLIEDTFDWYAQDAAGNVWYMGEDVTNYEYDDDDEVIATDHEGAWEAGVDGAVAGILIKATLIPGDSYQQEYYEGEAEDMAEVVALAVEVELEDGTKHTCLKTREWDPLDDEGGSEFKYYASNLGLVLEEKDDGSERAELLGLFDVSESSLPDFDAATFTNPANITHNYLGYAIGSVTEFEKETDEGLETIRVEVLAGTRAVNGIACRVVRDRVWLDGVLVEDTHDWYAQDDDGNVWYMGEEVVNYEYDDDGNLEDTNDDGSWEAGVDGAEAGIIMWAAPIIGQSYRQEFYEEEAEDMAVIVALDVTVELEDGSEFEGCYQILEWTPLEPDALEYKYFAPGVGVIVEETAAGDERVELTSDP